jgi:hypothetical protein
MAREFGSHYSLTMVAKFALPLNRKSYQVNSPSTNSPNDLFNAGFTIVPEWKVLPNLSLTNEIDLSFVAKGKAPYNLKDGNPDPINDIRYSYKVTNELALVYTFKSFYDLGLGGFWQVEYPFGNDALSSPEASIEKGSHHVLGLRLAKTFNL